MAQFEVNLRDLYRVFRKRKWVLITTPVLMALLTFALTAPSRVVYEATSRVKISKSSSLSSILVDVISYGQGDNLQTQSEVIKSQPVLALVAKMEGKIPGHMPYNEIVRNPRYVDVINDLKGRVQTEQVKASDIIEIRCTADTEPQAISLANNAAAAYRQYSSDERNKQVIEAIRFIEQQLERTTIELQAAEEGLRGFRTSHARDLGLSLTDATIERDRLNALERNLPRVQSALAQAERGLSLTSLSSFTPVYTEADDENIRRANDQIVSLLEQYSKLSLERDQLKTYQTDQSPKVQELTNQMAALQAAIRDRLQRLVGRYRELIAELEARKQASQAKVSGVENLPELTRQQAVLEAQVKRLTEMVGYNVQKLQEAKIQEAAKIEEVSIIESATAASEKKERSRFYQALVGLLIGLMLGAVLAFLLESLDTSIGTIEDVEKFLDVVVLGVVPHIDLETVKSKIDQSQSAATVSPSEIEKFAHLCTHFDPKSVTSEAYRTLRTNLDILLKKNKAKSILLTSSVLQEGKTTTATNVAVAFAQAGQKTLLIDADIRKPNVDKVMGVSRAPGLRDILLGLMPWQDVVCSIDSLILGKYGLKNARLTPGLEYLFIIPAGRSVENPAEILNSEKLPQLMEEFKQSFDVILVDVSPILPVADASILAPRVDGVVVAYQIGRVGRDVLKRSKNRLESVAANVWGVVMNDIQAEIDYRRGDYQYYSYTYKEELAPAQSFADRVRSRVGALISRSGRNNDKAVSIAPPPVARGTGKSRPDTELSDIMNLTDDE